jgi:hypothetical protein
MTPVSQVPLVKQPASNFTKFGAGVYKRKLVIGGGVCPGNADVLVGHYA